MITSGAVAQNIAGFNRPFPSSYNPLARPQSQDVARPFDPSKAFDTGFPKDVSPYQPRVVEYTTEIPRSVFRPKKYGKRLALKNGAFFGQTTLKNIFGGEQNAVTDYMAQRLLGIVDDRMSESMQQDDPYQRYQSTAPSSATTASAPSSSSSDQTMQGSPTVQSPVDANLFDLSLGPVRDPRRPAPLTINTSVSQAGTPTASAPAGSGPTTASTDAFFDALAEVETQPVQALTTEGEITQETEAGPSTIIPARGRGFGMRDMPDSPEEEEFHGFFRQNEQDLNRAYNSATVNMRTRTAPITHDLQDQINADMEDLGVPVERRQGFQAAIQHEIDVGARNRRNIWHRNSLNNAVLIRYAEHVRQFPEDAEGLQRELNRRYIRVNHGPRRRV